MKNLKHAIPIFIFAALGVPGVVFADTSFSFTTDAQTIPVSTVSSAITIHASAAVTQTTCLLVSSNSSTGQFSTASSSASWSSVHVVTMSKSTSKKTFYYMNSVAGSYTITVEVAPRPDSVSDSCANWSEAVSNVQSTVTQSIIIGSGSATQQTQTQTQTQSDSQQSSSVQQSIQSGGAPSPLSARITGDTLVMVGGGSYFDGQVFTANDLPLDNARYVWNFGDGATAEGQIVFHAYSYPGTYAVMLTAEEGALTGIATMQVGAVAAQVALEAEADGSLLVKNNSSQDIDVGFWSLAASNGSFTIPKATILLARGGIRFSPATMRFLAGVDAQLRYPNGSVAAYADPSMDSPARGEAVSASDMQKQKTVAKINTSSTNNIKPVSSGVVLGTSTNAAPKNSLPDTTTLSFLGLGGLVVLGGAGALFVRSSLRPKNLGAETPVSAEEFDIE